MKKYPLRKIRLLSKLAPGDKEHGGDRAQYQWTEGRETDYPKDTPKRASSRAAASQLSSVVEFRKKSILLLLSIATILLTNGTVVVHSAMLAGIFPTQCRETPCEADDCKEDDGFRGLLSSASHESQQMGYEISGIGNQIQQVTAAQYCDFLNHVAASDPKYLYNQTQASDPRTASIVRISTPGRWHYEVIAGRENFPIYYVNEVDEIFYLNWLYPSIEEVTADVDEISGLKSNRSSFQEVVASTPLLSLASASIPSASSFTIEDGGDIIAVIGLLAFGSNLMLRRTSPPTIPTTTAMNNISSARPGVRFLPESEPQDIQGIKKENQKEGHIEGNSIAQVATTSPISSLHKKDNEEFIEHERKMKSFYVTSAPLDNHEISSEDVPLEEMKHSFAEVRNHTSLKKTKTLEEEAYDKIKKYNKDFKNILSAADIAVDDLPEKITETSAQSAVIHKEAYLKLKKKLHSLIRLMKGDPLFKNEKAAIMLAENAIELVKRAPLTIDSKSVEPIKMKQLSSFKEITPFLAVPDEMKKSWYFNESNESTILIEEANDTIFDLESIKKALLYQRVESKNSLHLNKISRASHSYVKASKKARIASHEREGGSLPVKIS